MISFLIDFFFCYLLGLVGAMIFLFVLGIIYEGIKTGRELLKKQSAARRIPKGETYNLSGGQCKKVESIESETVVNSARYFFMLPFLGVFYSPVYKCF